ncbi:hypothetical protein F1536_00535 [Achromobacter xylosoxidans]|uniref:hypothetical protein n=1 Tax=Alcaligenes xylosoxydans xylosoxydans TaxID=85698 RepID=UPI001231B6F7|nr:hypothetical protein [Achromobacter xylosoxidans]KAA5924214.1 hypothetical protein F1536_00535 [Achromobacter xylosoxidans]
MCERWGTVEEAIAVAGVAIGTAVAIWGWPSWNWSTLGTWAGAAGSASAAWAAYKAATVPHALRRREERIQGATDIDATEGRITQTIKELNHIKQRIERRHQTWKAARTKALEFQQEFAEPQRLLDPTEIPKKVESTPYDRIHTDMLQQAKATQQRFTSLTREELEQCVFVLNVIPESSVRLFDVRMAIALAQARAEIATAIDKASHPARWKVICGHIDKAIGELDIYARGVPTAKSLVSSASS